MLVITDETLARRLREIAEESAESIEAVLEQAVTHMETARASERMQAAFFQEAQEYWKNEGNTARLRLSRAEFEQQFIMFSREGKPLLREDMTPADRQSLISIIEEAAFDSGDPYFARNVDDLITSSVSREGEDSA